MHTPLRGSRIEGQRGGYAVAYSHPRGMARQEVQDSRLSVMIMARSLLYYNGSENAWLYAL